MSSLNWTRWSGPAAMAGGALMLAGVLQTVDPEHRVAQKLVYLWPVIPMLFLATIAGLFRRRPPGWLATAGLMLALFGAAVSALALAIGAWFPTGPAYGIGLLGMAVLSAGVGVFGIGAVRHRVLPRWNALPLMIGLLFGLALVFSPELVPGRLVPWAWTAILALDAGAWIGLGCVLSDSRGDSQSVDINQ